MFYIIGLGLSDAKDVSLRGLEIIKKSQRVFLEAYTSILLCPKSELEECYGKSVIEADRTMVEQESDYILKDADKEDVCFLVVGDPLSATTHTDLILRFFLGSIIYFNFILFHSIFYFSFWLFIILNLFSAADFFLHLVLRF